MKPFARVNLCHRRGPERINVVASICIPLKFIGAGVGPKEGKAGQS